MAAVHSIDELLAGVEALHASDLHLAAGSPPLVRINGVLNPLEDAPAITPEDTQRLLYQILSTEQQKRLEIDRQIDISHSLSGVGRFRVNIFFQRNAVGGAFRLIPHKIRTLEELGHPPVLQKLTERPRGLVLVTGPTGSGKSTTLAAMIDEINRTRAAHILTIEDPIEFLHRHRKCLVNQREIGADARGFAEALRGALRQDPDVILLGEMRDLETISTALTAAETGHLVFATLHTRGAAATIDRIIDVFPGEQQAQIRAQLAVGARRRRHPDAAADRRRPRPSRRDGDPAARLRGPEPDPPAQARADVLGDSDRDRARHADAGAVAGGAGAARVGHRRGRARAARATPTSCSDCSAAGAARRTARPRSRPA